MDTAVPTSACVDASFVAALLLGEPAGASAGLLWDTWVAAERPLISATHFAAEAVSAIRRAQTRGRLSEQSAEDALRIFLQQILPDVDVRPGAAVTWQRARQWARQLRRSGVYDTIYLAIAEEMGAEFWTADENLCRALEADGRTAPAWVHLLTP